MYIYTYIYALYVYMCLLIPELRPAPFAMGGCFNEVKGGGPLNQLGLQVARRDWRTYARRYSRSG